MVASPAAFFPSVFPSPSSKTSMMLEGGSNNSTIRACLNVKANAQAPPKINGTSVGFTASESVKGHDEMPSPAPRTFINQLPDWSVLLAAITTVFLAAEKQWTLLDWKPRRPDMLVDPFGLGSIVQDGLVFRQNFSIRSYEIGADRTASIETLMNHLQETALNHVRSAGLLGDGFGSTPEMSIRDLIWVVTRMQLVVDRYPSWADVVQVDTWVSASGKNGMRRDWVVRDSNTGETLTRATSVWVMMNKKTRKLSKIPEEVRREIEPYFMQCEPVLDEDSRKLPKLDNSTAEHVRTGLTPRWNDLDVNQHVNNVKYIGWILESAPVSILETHELAGITLEYRRECGRESVLQSLSAASSSSPGATACSVMDTGGAEYDHLLRLESGVGIVRGRTKWRPKYAHNCHDARAIPAENT